MHQSREHRGPRRYGAWAIVTGASSGIGRAFAIELARSGVSVVLVARRRDALEALAAELRTAPVEALVVAADLGTAAGIAALESAVEALDVGMLVAAAGFGTSGPFLDADLASEREMLEVNCWATLALAHAFARTFIRRERGAIVLFASLVGRQGTPYAAHYAATKAYVHVLAEGLRVEFAPLGIDVVACAPGPVDSGFAARARMTMGRAARPADVPGETLRALGKRDTVVPGTLAKFLTTSLGLLPRPMRVRAMGKIMLGMTQATAGDGTSSPAS